MKEQMEIRAKKIQTKENNKKKLKMNNFHLLATV
jgi:hypothetical protein